MYHQVKGHSTNVYIEMNNKLHKLLENEKVNYVTNEESNNEIVKEYDDEGYNNMVNMVSLIEYCAHT